MSGKFAGNRLLPAAIVVLLVLAGGASTGGIGSAGARIGPAPGPEERSFAHAAGSVAVNDTGHLHLLKAVGSVLYEEGYATGTLPGQTKVRMVVGSAVSASFAIGARGGVVYGSGHAALHSSGRYASFGGSLSVSHGSGRYARAHGSGRIYGVIDRRSDAVTVQTTGKLLY
jgi:hypothetical protein